MNLKTAAQVAQCFRRAGVPLIVFGSHGIGKTSIVYQMHNPKFSTLAIRSFVKDVFRNFTKQEPGLWSLAAPTITSEELIGLPDKQDGVVRYLRGDNFLPPMDHEGGGIWLIDEPNRAFPEVEKALFQLLLEGRYLDYTLPKGVWICMTANPPGGDYQVREMDPAVLNRCGVINVEPDADIWAEWARNNGVSEAAIAFRMTAGRDLMNPAARKAEVVSNDPTDRSLSMFDKVYQSMTGDEKRTVLVYEVACACVGSAAGGALADTYRNQDSKPVTGREVFNNYDAVRGRVIAGLTDGTRAVEELAVTLSGVRELLDKKFLENREAGGNAARCRLTAKDQQGVKNCFRFLNDLPADMCRAFVDENLSRRYNGFGLRDAESDYTLAFPRAYENFHQ